MENNIYQKETPFGNYLLIERDNISETIRHHGIWEHHLYMFYSEMIKPEYHIIDGGANIGFHSVQFAKFATKGKVYCYEPRNFIFNILSANILMNGLSSRVYQYRLGLGNDKKQNSLKLDSLDKQIMGNLINYGGAGLAHAEEGEDTVSIVGIDSLNLPQLDFIKLDIQGMEYDCLIGSENTIKKYSPILFLEIGICSASKWNREHGDDSLPPSHQKIFDLLCKWGYKDYQIKVNGRYPGDTIFLNPNKHIEEVKIFKNISKKII